MFATIVDPDTKAIDVYSFTGSHEVICSNSEEAKMLTSEATNTNDALELGAEQGVAKRLDWNTREFIAGLEESFNVRLTEEEIAEVMGAKPYEDEEEDDEDEDEEGEDDEGDEEGEDEYDDEGSDSGEDTE